MESFYFHSYRIFKRMARTIIYLILSFIGCFSVNSQIAENVMNDEFVHAILKEYGTNLLSDNNDLPIYLHICRSELLSEATSICTETIFYLKEVEDSDSLIMVINASGDLDYISQSIPNDTKRFDNRFLFTYYKEHITSALSEKSKRRYLKKVRNNISYDVNRFIDRPTWLVVIDENDCLRLCQTRHQFFPF